MLKLPEKGDVISARDMRELIQLAESALQRQVLPKDDGYPFRNDSGEEVPRHAVMMAYGVAHGERSGNPIPDADKYITEAMTKPSSTPSTSYFVNFPSRIAIRRQGRCWRAGDIAIVLYDGDAPELNDELGPVADQWYASASGGPKIFTCLGVVDSTKKLMLARIHESSPAAVLFYQSNWVTADYTYAATIPTNAYASMRFAQFSPDSSSEIIENLYSTCSHVNDPCVKILRAGLWRVKLQIWGGISENTMPWPLQTLTTASGGDPSHTHAYDVPLFNSIPYLRVTGSVNAQKEDETTKNTIVVVSGNHSYFDNHSDGKLLAMNTFDIDLDANTSLDVQVYPNCSSTTTYSCDLNGSLELTWMGPKGSAPTFFG